MTPDKKNSIGLFLFSNDIYEEMTDVLEEIVGLITP